MTPTDFSNLLRMATTVSIAMRDVTRQENMVADARAELEREYNDITHRMEAPDCLYQERARLATRLQRVQQERRVLKDWQIVNDAILRFMATDRGARMLKHLEEFIGVARRVEEEKARRRAAAEERINGRC